MQKRWEPIVWHRSCHRIITTALEFAVVKVDGKLGCNGNVKCFFFVLLLLLSLVLLARQLQSVMCVHQAWVTVDDVYVVFSDVFVVWVLLYLEMAIVGTSNPATICGHWIGPGIVSSSQQLQRTQFAISTFFFKQRCKKLGEVKQQFLFFYKQTHKATTYGPYNNRVC